MGERNWFLQALLSPITIVIWLVYLVVLVSLPFLAPPLIFGISPPDWYIPTILSIVGLAAFILFSAILIENINDLDINVGFHESEDGDPGGYASESHEFRKGVLKYGYILEEDGSKIPYNSENLVEDLDEGDEVMYLVPDDAGYAENIRGL
jgi:hypothetical protein